MDVAMVIEVHVLSSFPQMIHQMEGLVKWRDRQMASGKGQRT